MKDQIPSSKAIRCKTYPLLPDSNPISNYPCYPRILRPRICLICKHFLKLFQSCRTPERLGFLNSINITFFLSRHNYCWHRDGLVIAGLILVMRIKNIFIIIKMYNTVLYLYIVLPVSENGWCISGWGSHLAERWPAFKGRVKPLFTSLQCRGPGGQELHLHPL